MASLELDFDFILLLMHFYDVYTLLNVTYFAFGTVVMHILTLLAFLKFTLG